MFFLIYINNYETQALTVVGGDFSTRTISEDIAVPIGQIKFSIIITCGKRTLRRQKCNKIYCSY